MAIDHIITYPIIYSVLLYLQDWRKYYRLKSVSFFLRHPVCFISMYFSHFLAFVDISLARCCFMLQHRPYVSNCMAYQDLLTNTWVKYNYIKWSYKNSNNGTGCWLFMSRLVQILISTIKVIWHKQINILTIEGGGAIENLKNVFFHFLLNALCSTLW